MDLVAGKLLKSSPRNLLGEVDFFGFLAGLAGVFAASEPLLVDFGQTAFSDDIIKNVSGPAPPIENELSPLRNKRPPTPRIGDILFCFGLFCNLQFARLQFFDDGRSGSSSAVADGDTSQLPFFQQINHRN